MDGLANKGLAKLAEECGELSTIAGKKMAFMDTDEHPDGKGSLKKRMEDEIADVRAISRFVIEKFELDSAAIKNREEDKVELFHYWDAGGTEIAIPPSYIRTDKGNLPNFAFLTSPNSDYKCAMRLRGNSYFRDGGQWSCHIKVVGGKIFANHPNPDSILHHIDGYELVPCTEKEWKEDNGSYAPSKEWLKHER